MEKLKQKLSSRKLWITVIGIIIGLAAAFGIEENDYAQIAGIVTSAVSVVGYVFGEAKVDAARQAYEVPDLSEIIEECKAAEGESEK